MKPKQGKNIVVAAQEPPLLEFVRAVKKRTAEREKEIMEDKEKTAADLKAAFKKAALAPKRLEVLFKEFEAAPGIGNITIWEDWPLGDGYQRCREMLAKFTGTKPAYLLLKSKLDTKTDAKD